MHSHSSIFLDSGYYHLCMDRTSCTYSMDTQFWFIYIIATALQALDFIGLIRFRDQNDGLCTYLQGSCIRNKLLEKICSL